MAKPKYQYELKYDKDGYQYFSIYRNDELVYDSLPREKTDFWQSQLYDVIQDLLYISDNRNRRILQREEVYLKAMSDRKTGITLSFSNDPKAKEIKIVQVEQRAETSTPDNIPSNTPGKTTSDIFINGTYKRDGRVLDPNNPADAAIIEEIKTQFIANEASIASTFNTSGNNQATNELVTNAKAEAEAAKKKAKELADKAKKELADKAKKAKELIADQKKKLEDFKKATNDKINFLKDQTKISPAQAKAAIVAILLPILAKFINAEKVANAIINKLINKTKKQLKNKGRVVVSGGKIVFTPKDNRNYQKFKEDFDNKVKSLKKTVSILKTSIDTLLTILKIMRAVLIATKVYIIILKAKMKKLAAKAAIESASPSPAKPANAEYLAFKEINEPIIKELEKKLDDYSLAVTAATTILSTFQKLINRILAKLNTLSFTITSQPTSNVVNNLNEDLVNIINEKSTQTLEYEYTSIDNKEYTIRIITTPSGAKQAVAYEKFSNLKITQTAPSLVRNEDQLLEELKQILG